MSINFVETRKNFDASLMVATKCARFLNVSPELFRKVMAGKYPAMNGKEARRVLQWLRERDILVETPDEQPDQAA